MLIYVSVRQECPVLSLSPQTRLRSGPFQVWGRGCSSQSEKERCGRGEREREGEELEGCETYKLWGMWLCLTGWGKWCRGVESGQAGRGRRSLFHNRMWRSVGSLCSAAPVKADEAKAWNNIRVMPYTKGRSYRMMKCLAYLYASDLAVMEER